MAEAQPLRSLEEVGVAVAAGISGQPARKISQYTVRRRLREHGVRTRVAAQQIDTSARHREQRVPYAERMVDREDEFWMGVKFSDEKAFSSESGSMVYVRR